MTLLDGKKLATDLKTELAIKVDEQITNGNRKPKLVVILVGNDPSSEIYVRNKAKACEKVHIDSEVIKLDENTDAQTLENIIIDNNNKKDVDAILLQLPLPKQLDESHFIQLIDPAKDVDGFHFINQGKIMENVDGVRPCTPDGIMKLLKEYDINPYGKNVVMVGTSLIVGRPMGMMMLNAGASVDFCNSKTKNLKEHTLKADIIISATGVKHLITEDMVKDGAVIVDVGIIRDNATNKVYGDVDFDKVKNKASFITPVPGGVGPMTISSLLENTFSLYLNNLKKVK